MLAPPMHVSPDSSIVPVAVSTRPAGHSSVPALILIALALVPVAWIAREAMLAARNIAQWDDYQQVLTLIIRDQERAPGSSMVDEIVSANSGHRTILSRAIVLTAYRIFGHINFDALAALGFAWLLAACGILVAATPGREARVRLVVLLAFGIFTLQHYESFLWAGSSIDHFAVVLMACASFALIGARWRRGWLAGIVFAILGTFTLAHGLAIWPIGALMLAQRRRWRELITWMLAAMLTVAIYFTGSESEAVPGPAALGGAAFPILHFWLTLLGSPATPGQPALAPWFGLILVALTVFRVRRLCEHENPAGLALTLWTLLATALLAAARAEMLDGLVQSRYMILGAFAWVLNFAWLLDQTSAASRPYRAIVACLPVLGVFTCLANTSSAENAATFVEQRDRAALSYNRYHEDGRAKSALHPSPATATDILHRCDHLGIYHFPALCQPVPFEEARPSARIAYGIETLDGDEHSIALSGWAAIPGRMIRRGDIEVVLRSESRSLTWTTVQMRRVDLVREYDEPRWRMAGFQLVISRDALPAGRYQIGLRLANRGRPEFTMTDEILDTTRASPTREHGYESLPEMCAPRRFKDAQPSGRIAYFVEDIEQRGKFVSIRGWAGIPGTKATRGTLNLVLQAEDGQLHAFKALQKPRPDVVAAMSEPEWRMPGFHVILESSQIPEGAYRVGFLVNLDNRPEFILTDHMVHLAPDGAPPMTAQIR